MDLLSILESDNEAVSAASYLTVEQRKGRMANLRKERTVWRNSSVEAAANVLADQELTDVSCN